MAQRGDARAGKSRSTQIDEHFWSPHKAQRKHEIMYRLRERIRDEEVGVEQGLRSVMFDVGDGLSSLLDDALQSKCPEDGQNLLMTAAIEGHEAWFLRLADEVRSRLGVAALVKELQEVDIDGAPLLFHAASSRGERSCFRTAREVICTVLGKGGRMEQAEAKDTLGRGILMHAARSNHVDTFREVSDMVLETARSMGMDYFQQPAGEMANSHKVLAEKMSERDAMGMNCLHHAAEAGCRDVLREVIEKCGGRDSSTYKEMGGADKLGRTPIMLVLTNACRCGEEHIELREKFRTLYEGMPGAPISTPGGGCNKEGWMTDPTEVSSYCPEGKTRAMTEPLHAARGGKSSSPKRKTRAKAELLHAARGGKSSLQLALNHCNTSFKTPVDGGIAVDLDQALAVEERKEKFSWGPSKDTKTWGRALMLAAAARLGDVDVLCHVLMAVETGKFTLQARMGEIGAYDLPEVTKGKDRQPIQLPMGDRIKEALDMLKKRRVSLFSSAISSGRIEAVELVYKLVVGTFGYKNETTWSIISGKDSRRSSLTCAASASFEAHTNGVAMFDKVFSLMKQQRTSDATMRAQWAPKSLNFSDPAQTSPLAGAVFSSNWKLFRKVYEAFEEFAGHRWFRTSVIDQIPKLDPELTANLEPQELHERPDGIPKNIPRGEGCIPAVMWHYIVKACRHSKPDEGGQSAYGSPLPSWTAIFRDFSRRAVKASAARGSFTALRDLVKEGFPLHDSHIRAVVDNIGDHEEDVVETILCAVANASNPFAMSATVSRVLQSSMLHHRMQKKGLRRLERMIDDLSNELLDKLPQTVRGMGLKLRGGKRPITFENGVEDRAHRRLENLAGFIAAQWILEPDLLVKKRNHELRYEGPDYIDPLRRALDRGPKGLDLLNAPLVLDYVHVKFTSTLPSWRSRNPWETVVNEGFYSFTDKAKAPRHGSEEGRRDESCPPTKEKVKIMSKSFLLRLLQGKPYRFPKPMPKGDASVQNNENDVAEETEPELVQISNGTVLPGLQFSLAGILGKPEIFYRVPVIRFVYAIFWYLVMLVLFCSSLLLKEHDFVPLDEAIFYFFAAALIFREVSEFHDAMPARQHSRRVHRAAAGDIVAMPCRTSSSRADSDSVGKPKRDAHCVSKHALAQSRSRVVSAFIRYAMYDTWNFLDTTTIACILVAFVFRMMALDNKFFLFHAQFFYALSAPLLFSRLLVLSQVDATLGPMTQVIWRMMSHTLRFSAFIAIVMLSFALAFHAVFHTCSTGAPLPGCDLDDNGVSNPLGEAFGSFGASFVTMFSSALGGPDFEPFDVGGSDCRCDLPEGAARAGIFLMVVYMITIGVVLLNLLIAVLSTAHDQVYANAEKEFHLARARLIYQSARVVERNRPPPPLNLIRVFFGILLDTGNEFVQWYRSKSCSSDGNGKRQSGGGRIGAGSDKASSRGAGAEAANAATGVGAGAGADALPPAGQAPTVAPADDASEFARGGADLKKWKPASQTHAWETIEGGIQRLVFSCTFGASALVVFGVLWLLSVPWITWCLFRREPRPNVSDGGEQCADGDDTYCSQEDDPEYEVGDGKNDDPGYFRKLKRFTLSFIYLSLLSLIAFGLCLLYISLSVILWVIGVCRIFEWVSLNWKKEKDNRTPAAMPGQEDEGTWEEAWSLASRRNEGVREDRGQAHFHVMPFLKSKTGLDMQHLAWLVRARDAKSKSEQELMEADRRLPDARISLDNLSERVKRRAAENRRHPRHQASADERGTGGHGASGAPSVCRLDEGRDQTGGGNGGGGGGGDIDGRVALNQRQAGGGNAHFVPREDASTDAPEPVNIATEDKKEAGGRKRGVRRSDGSRRVGFSITEYDEEKHGGEGPDAF